MPETVTPPETPPETANPPSSSAPPSTPTTSPTEWRAGPNAEEWARGKTGEEILGITRQLAATLEQVNRSNQVTPGNTRPANQIYAQQQAEGPTFNDDDYLTGKQVRQFAATLQQQQAPQFQQLTNLAASAVRATVQRDHAEVFKRYGPEVEATFALIPREQWTVDNLKQAVNLVRGNHIEDELTAARAAERQRLLSEVPPTMRPTGGAGPAHQSPTPGSPSIRDETLPAQWRSRAEAVGLTDTDVYDFCRANGQTVEQFFKQFEKPLGVVVEDVSVNQPRST